jgi:predicted DNA-binding transcriptional regulator AlpA
MEHHESSRTEIPYPAERPEAWFTRKEAASYLRPGESTLAKLFVSGNGPQAVKIGRSVRYSSVNLDNWMAARRRRSTSDTGSL